MKHVHECLWKAMQLEAELPTETPMNVVETSSAMRRLMNVQVEDMPPNTDDVGLLLNTIELRFAMASRADVWRSIGIKPKEGRALLSRSTQRLNWPIWFTLVEKAFR